MLIGKFLLKENSSSTQKTQKRLAKKTSIDLSTDFAPNERNESTVSKKTFFSQSDIGLTASTKKRSKQNPMPREQILDCPPSMIDQLVFKTEIKK